MQLDDSIQRHAITCRDVAWLRQAIGQESTVKSVHEIVSVHLAARWTCMARLLLPSRLAFIYDL